MTFELLIDFVFVFQPVTLRRREASAKFFWFKHINFGIVDVIEWARNWPVAAQLTQGQRKALPAVTHSEFIWFESFYLVTVSCAWATRNDSSSGQNWLESSCGAEGGVRGSGARWTGVACRGAGRGARMQRSRRKLGSPEGGPGECSPPSIHKHWWKSFVLTLNFQLQCPMAHSYL